VVIVLLARGVQFIVDPLCQRVRRQHADVAAESENPAAERVVVADVEGQDNGTVGAILHLLRGVKRALLHQRRDLRVESELHPDRRAAMRTERVLEGIGVELGDWLERVFLRGRSLDPLHCEGSRLRIRWDEGDEVQTTFGVNQAIRVASLRPPRLGTIRRPPAGGLAATCALDRFNHCDRSYR